MSRRCAFEDRTLLKTLFQVVDVYLYSTRGENMALRLLFMFGIAVMGRHSVICTPDVTKHTVAVERYQTQFVPICNDAKLIRVLARTFEPYVIDTAFKSEEATQRIPPPLQGIDIKIMNELSRKLQMPYSLLFDGDELNTTISFGMKV